MKLLKLHPPAVSGDTTISAYHRRTFDTPPEHDPSKITVKLPMTSVKNRMETDLNKMREEMQALKARLATEDMERISCYGVELLTKVIDKIEKSNKKTSPSGPNGSNHSTSRYVRMVENLSDREFIKTAGLPHKCFTLLKKYPKASFPSEILRNAAVDETVSALAGLLMDPAYKESYYHVWSPFIEFVHEKSIEALADEVKGIFNLTSLMLAKV